MSTLMTNHVHLLLRTGLASISTAMRRLLTGYAHSGEDEGTLSLAPNTLCLLRISLTRIASRSCPPACRKLA